MRDSIIGWPHEGEKHSLEYAEMVKDSNMHTGVWISSTQYNPSTWEVLGEAAASFPAT